MNDPQNSMTEAARLTRTGRLSEATALIQRALGIKKAGEPSRRPASSAEAPIDAEFTVLDDTTSPERQWIERTYSNAHGRRPYKLYLPHGYTGQNVPLLVMLHGCSQSSLDFASGTRMNELADRHMFLVAYPEQVTSANSSKCWRWFQAPDQQRDKGEPSLIAGITRQIMSNFNVDHRQVYIAGLSSGGAMAAILAATYPDLYAAVGVHSGLPYGAAHNLRSAFTAMRRGASQWNASIAETIPLIIFHGDADTTVAPINAHQLADQWLEASERRSGAKQRRDSRGIEGQIAGGHRYTRTIYQDRRGQVIVEKWMVHQAGHAWAGGSSNGSFTDARGPDASREMFRFFADHPKKW